jgi:hypothetical protein
VPANLPDRPFAGRIQREDNNAQGVSRCVIAAAGFSSAALAEGKKMGVSWAQFQEERWKIDEAAMKAAIEAAATNTSRPTRSLRRKSSCRTSTR